jgi:hypothetical protein
MRKNVLLVGFVAGLLLIGSAFAATAKHHGSTAANGTLKMSGKIVSNSNSELVLSSTKNGKSEQETFVVNPQTKTKGSLSSGERAIVRYKNENGQKVATMISARKMNSSKTK